MPYQLLGSRTLAGSNDSQKINPYLPGTGWVVQFTPQILATSLTQFEVYQISLDGPVGFGVLVTINNQPWNFVAQGWQNWWDPSQPMILRQTDEVDFLYQAPFTSGPYNKSTNVAATVTLWLRQDLGLGVNPGGQ
jgi:hypothetical protein